MAEVLKCLPNLENLELRNNSINDVKFLEFSSALAEMPLKSLDLCASQISNQSIGPWIQ